MENDRVDARYAEAFRPHGLFRIVGAAEGPLVRGRLGVKDLFDIAGYRTGAGNPDWLRTHEPAAHTAPAVERLLQAGADIVGKTLTDELAYSLNGENHHYGTPLNPASPDRIPGGSSCGSAVAVAAGLCDIGLGTDTAGSIRLPATFCGAWGFRPTHGAVSSEGVVPLAPSYDVVGWITRDAEWLVRTGSVLLPADRGSPGDLPRWLLVPDDAWGLAVPKVRPPLEAALSALGTRFEGIERCILAEGDGLMQWQQAFRVIQGHEVWSVHADWIGRCKPRFGPGIRERFEWARTITADAAAAASRERQRIAGLLDRLLEDAILCIPTVPFIAPRRNSSAAEENRTRALCLLSIASLAGLPQVTIPVPGPDGCAVGLSLLAARGMDRALLARTAEAAAGLF